MVGSGVRNLPIAEARSWGFIVRAVLVLGALAGVALYAARRDRFLLALLAWALLALLPVLLTADISVPVGADTLPVSDRWLYHALGPTIVAWVRLVEPLARTLPVQRALTAGAAVWAAWMLVRCSAEDRCRFEERKVARAQLRGDSDATDAAAREALAVCGRTPERVAARRLPRTRAAPCRRAGGFRAPTAMEIPELRAKAEPRPSIPSTGCAALPLRASAEAGAMRKMWRLRRPNHTATPCDVLAPRLRRRPNPGISRSRTRGAARSIARDRESPSERDRRWTPRRPRGGPRPPAGASCAGP